MILMLFVFTIFFVLTFSLFYYVFVLSLLLGVMLLFLSVLNMKSSGKFMSYASFMKYECGYTEINSSNNFYTMQFFVVALSFMLFDMEIVLVLPFLYSNSFSFVALGLVSVFLGLLMLSLLFEVNSNVFKWKNV